MDADKFLHTPNPLSTFHPFLPLYRLPEGTFKVQPQSLIGGDNTPILHKESNANRKIDSLR